MPTIYYVGATYQNDNEYARRTYARLHRVQTYLLLIALNTLSKLMDSLREGNGEGKKGKAAVFAFCRAEASDANANSRGKSCPFGEAALE